MQDYSILVAVDLLVAGDDVIENRIFVGNGLFS